MRSCEIAVVGLGIMGSAALYALRRRNVDVLGFDPLRVGEPRGSSHGSCRIFRRFNFENPAYTALSAEALRGWRALEAHSGAKLLLDCPLLESGPPGSRLVQASRGAALSAGAADGAMTAAEANAAFPAFHLPETWEVVVQDNGAVLLAEAAVRAFRQGAGARIIQDAARLVPSAAGVRIVASGEDVMAKTVIVAAGPWIGELIPGLGAHLSVTRQAVGWFTPARPEIAALGRFPMFILDAPEGIVYGFPDFEGRGVKAARHDHGPRAGSDDWETPPTDNELQPVRSTLDRFIPGAAGPIAGRDCCLYTNTRPADLLPDRGEEFILDRLPQDRRIIVASPCSGHGAKFASAIGEMLADLALDEAFETDAAFRLDRFSSFGRAART